MFRSQCNSALLILVASTLSFAQEPSKQDSDVVLSDVASSETKDADAVHDAIRELRDRLLAAIDAKEIDAVLSCFHEDAVLTSQDGELLLAVRKHAGLRSYMQRLFIGPDAGVKALQLNVEVDELTILHGTGCGVAFGSSRDHYVLSDQREFDLATRWSATVVLDGERWVIANLHVSTNLFDNPVVSTYKRWVVIAGGIGALLGALLGAVVMRMMRRPATDRAAA